MKRKKEKSHYLFDLIKSLTGTEKRYFSLFSKRHIINEKNNYSRLFDLINQQEVYNEAVIVKKLTNKKFSARLDKHKKDLSVLILKSLRLFHSRKTLQMEMNEQIDFIELLKYKRQWKLCQKHIEQAKIFAMKNDLFTGYIDVIGQELNMMQSNSNLQWLKNNIDTIRLEECQALEKQANYFKYRRQINLAKIWITENSAVSNSRVARKKFKSVFNSSLTNNIKNALSDKAIILFHHINGQRFYFSGDYTRSLNHFQLLHKFIRSVPHRLKQYPKVYTAAIHNIINIFQRTGKFYIAIKYVNKLKQIPTGIGLSREETYVRYFEQLLCTYVYFGKFSEGVKKVNEVETWLEETDIGLIEKIRLIELYLYISYLLFGTGNYKRSLFYCNRIQRIDFKPKVLKDQHYYSKIMAIMNHLESGNEDICISLARSLLRNKSESELMAKHEKTIINFIYKKWFMINSETEQAAALTELKKDVIKSILSNKQAYAPEQFDFVRWIESKIENKPFAEVLREKVKR